MTSFYSNAPKVVLNGKTFTETNNSRGRSLQPIITNSRVVNLSPPHHVSSSRITYDQVKNIPIQTTTIIKQSRNIDHSRDFQRIYKGPEIITIMENVVRNSDSQIQRLKSMNQFLIQQYSHLYQQYQKNNIQNVDEQQIVNQNEFLRNAIQRVQQIFRQETDIAMTKINNVGRNYTRKTFKQPPAPIRIQRTIF